MTDIRDRQKEGGREESQDLTPVTPTRDKPDVISCGFVLSRPQCDPLSLRLSLRDLGHDGP